QPFSTCPQNYKPRMENTQQEQLQDAINRLIALWNQNLLLVKESLTLAENIITLPQLPNEGLLLPTEDNAIPLSLPVEKTLVPCDNILLVEDIETLAPVTENPTQIDHLEDSEKDCVRQIRNDLLVRSNNTSFQQNPILAQHTDRVSFEKIIMEDEVITKSKAIKEVIRNHYKNWTKINIGDNSFWPE
ncbi:1857_t:CDS:2, partial [Gigaspora margarita]